MIFQLSNVFFNEKLIFVLKILFIITEIKPFKYLDFCKFDNGKMIGDWDKNKHDSNDIFQPDPRNKVMVVVCNLKNDHYRKRQYHLFLLSKLDEKSISFPTYLCSLAHS